MQASKLNLEKKKKKNFSSTNFIVLKVEKSTIHEIGFVFSAISN